MWIRHPEIRKGRECVIPDISRTFHFGKSGLNLNEHFYKVYFSTRKLNKDPNAVLKVHFTKARWLKYLLFSLCLRYI